MGLDRANGRLPRLADAPDQIEDAALVSFHE